MGLGIYRAMPLPGRGLDLNENLVVFCCKVTTFFPVAVRFCPFQPDNAR